MPEPTVTLASGKQMPLVGFGLWKVSKENAADTVYSAVKTGYRLFDGAYDYQNEAEAGEGIRRAIADGLVTRDEIFITTKLWNNYHRREHTLSMAHRQNDAWGLEYIDLFLMHFPSALKYVDPAIRQYPGWWMDDAGTIEIDNVPIRETWEAMEEAVDRSIVRSIGVSNFQAQSLYDIKTYARHPISCLQIEHHPYLVQPELVKLAQENGVAVTAYSSFGPQSSVDWTYKFSERTRYLPALFDSKPVKALEAKYGVSPAQILLRWATQRGIAVIPKSNSPTRLKENLDALSFNMLPDELQSISAMDIGLRFNDPGCYLPDHPIRIFA